MRTTAASLGVITLGLIATAPSLAVADDQTPEKANTVKGVVVTATPPAPLTSTFTQSTISSVDIKRLSPAPTLTIQTLLNNQPSIFAYTNGAFGVGSNIYFRAFNSGQFTETYDGISLNDSFNASLNGNGAENVNRIILQTEDIDSVQVYRGVNNPAVNGYDSLGGTINFAPKLPDENSGGEAGASYGSFNTFQAHVTLNTGDYHGLRQMATFAYGTTDGWQQNTSDWNYNFYYALTYQPTDNQALRFFSVVNHNQGSPPDTIPLPLLQLNGFNFQFPKTVHSHGINGTNWLGILDYEYDASPTVTFDNKAFAGWDSYKRKSFTNPNNENLMFPGSNGVGYFLDDGPTFPFWIGSPNGPTYDPQAAFPPPADASPFAAPWGFGEQFHFYGYETWTAGDSPTLTLNLPRNKIVVGANLTWAWLWSREYWWGTVNVPTTEGFNDAWDEWDYRFLGSVYAQDEIELVPNTLFLTPGVKFLYAHTSDTDHVGFFYANKGTAAGNTDFVSPTVGLSYKPTSTLALYGAFGQNIKFPEISAFYGAIQSDQNGNLLIPPFNAKPEHVNDYELGARYENGGFFAEVDVYREDIVGTFITLLINGGANSETVNGGGSRYQGVEVQLKDTMHWMGADWTAYANYAHNEAKFTSDFTDQLTGNTVQAGTPLADVPSDLASGGVAWSFEGWEANVDVRYVGKQFTDQNQTGDLPTANTIPSYVVVDLGVAKTFEVETMGRAGSVKVGLNVDNLFNRRYFNQATTDTGTITDNEGNMTSTAPFLRGVVGAPLGVTGSITARF